MKCLLDTFILGVWCHFMIELKNYRCDSTSIMAKVYPLLPRSRMPYLKHVCKTGSGHRPVRSILGTSLVMAERSSFWELSRTSMPNSFIQPVNGRHLRIVQCLLHTARCSPRSYSNSSQTVLVRHRAFRAWEFMIHHSVKITSRDANTSDVCVTLNT